MEIGNTGVSGKLYEKSSCGVGRRSGWRKVNQDEGV